MRTTALLLTATVAAVHAAPLPSTPAPFEQDEAGRIIISSALLNASNWVYGHHADGSRIVLGCASQLTTCQ